MTQKHLFVLIFAIVFGFFCGDFIVGQRAEPIIDVIKNTDSVPVQVISFDHTLHGDSLGIDCATCHTGSRSSAKAYFPSKKDCLDCHRLPLTENPGIEILDSVLMDAPENPWGKESALPNHVVFHHGVHSSAKVSCLDCHEGPNFYKEVKLNMKTCLMCHRGEIFKDKGYKSAPTDCATCHR